MEPSGPAVVRLEVLSSAPSHSSGPAEQSVYGVDAPRLTHTPELGVCPVEVCEDDDGKV